MFAVYSHVLFKLPETIYRETAAEPSLSAFPCPVCRQNIVPTCPADPFSEWADGLPSNDLVASIEKSRTLLSKKKTCKLCVARDELDVAADLWCKHCNVFVCNSCKWMHDALHDDHVVIPINEIKEKPFSAIRHASLCKQHGDSSKLFCESHQDVGCQLCMATSHRGCKKILVTRDVALSIKQEKEIEALLDNFDNPTADIRSLIETVEGHFDILENDKNAAEDQIEMIMDEVKEHFLGTVTKLYKEGKEKNALKLKRCKQLEFALTHMRSSLLTALKIGDDADVVMMKIKGNAQLQKYCSEIHNEFKQREIGKVTMVPDVITDLKKIEIAKSTIDNYNQSAPLTNRMSYPLKAKLKQSFDVSLPSDKRTCDITGILFYQKDRIIAVDSANSSVKLITNTGEPLSHLRVADCKVWGLCQINPQFFAVSCGTSKKILMVEMDADQLVLKDTVTVDNPVYGIAYTGKSLVVTDGDCPTMIHEYSIDGKELSVTEGLDNMKNIVKLPKSGKLVVSRDDVPVSKGQILLMIYEDLKSQTSKPLLKLKDSIGGRVSSRSCREIHGMSVDDIDNVLFVDKTPMISMLSQNGNKQDLLSWSDGIKAPFAVSLYQSSFILSESESNIIKLYRMF